MLIGNYMHLSYFKTFVRLGWLQKLLIGLELVFGYVCTSFCICRGVFRDTWPLYLISIGPE